MVTINWCKKQTKGIQPTNPNDNVSFEYIHSAKETFDVLISIKKQSPMWLATTKYYFQYFLAYAILMKIGVKCEIHDCTIKVISHLQKKGFFPFQLASQLLLDKQLRIDNQYYLKNKEVSVNSEDLLELYLQVKQYLIALTQEQIKTMKREIERL